MERSRRSNVWSPGAVLLLLGGVVFSSCGGGTETDTAGGGSSQGGASGDGRGGTSSGTSGTSSERGGRGGSASGAGGDSGASGGGGSDTGGGDTGGSGGDGAGDGGGGPAGRGGTTAGSGGAGETGGGAGECGGVAGCGGAGDDCEPGALRCGEECCANPPNVNVACGTAGCEYSCAGWPLACDGTNGIPVCGSWDFESGTPEGWVVTNRQGGTNRDVPSGFTGLFETRPSHATSGNLALAVGFDGNGTDYWMIDLRVRPCPGSQPLYLHGHFLKFDVYAETGAGSAPFTNIRTLHFITLFNDVPENSGHVMSFCDFRFDPDAPFEFTCELLDFYDLGATAIQILMRIDQEPWRGTYYFDNFRIEPPPQEGIGG